MPSQLPSQIAQKREEIRQFEQSLEVLQNPPSVPVDRAQLPPLGRLEQILQGAQDASDRAARLVAMKQALTDSRAALAELEREWDTKQQAVAAALEEAEPLVQEFNRLSRGLVATASQLNRLGIQHQAIADEVLGAPLIPRLGQQFASYPLLVESSNGVYWVQQVRSDIAPSRSVFAA